MANFYQKNMNTPDVNLALQQLAEKVKQFIRSEAPRMLTLEPNQSIACKLSIVAKPVVKVSLRKQTKIKWREVCRPQNRATPTAYEWDQIFKSMDLPDRLRFILEKLKNSGTGSLEINTIDKVKCNDCVTFNRKSDDASLPWRLYFIPPAGRKSSPWDECSIQIFKVPPEKMT